LIRILIFLALRSEIIVKIVIAGGSGLIGRKLIARLNQDGHDLFLLTRRPGPATQRVRAARVLQWNAKTSNGLSGALDGAGAVINLAGASIASGRWTPRRKQEILQSRIESTRALVNAVEALNKKPSVFINASAVGYYGDCGEKAVTETSPKGNDFLAEVCARWEAEAMIVQKYGVRVVLLRSGLVLDNRGGALKRMLLPFRLFLGGRLGSGKQWLPWIHGDDEVSAILLAMNTPSLAGPVNLAAPGSVRMEEFCRKLGKAVRRPSWLGIPSLVLKAALGEMAVPLLLHSQNVMPKKLLEHGFVFGFPGLEEALEDLMR
jgi:uncharacterized protein (TIGR01777 family)